MKTSNLLGFFSIITVILAVFSAHQSRAVDIEFTPLEPVRTDSPQDTMRTFMTSMNAYLEAIRNEQPKRQQLALERAANCLDLSGYPALVQMETGKEAAIFLKEVMDRLLVIDYERIPPGKLDPSLRSPWRLKGSEIKISLIDQGERKGEYLFSGDTVRRSRSFYEAVKDRPFIKGSGGGAGYTQPWLQQRVPTWLQGNLLGVQRWQIIGAFLAILLGIIVRKIIIRILSLVGRFTKRTKTEFDDSVLRFTKQPVSWVVVSGFWFMSIRFLRFEGWSLTALNTIVQIIFSFAVVWSFYRLAAVISDYLHVLIDKADVGLDEQLIPIINKSVRIFVAVFGSLVAIQNLGINVMSLVAGLGLGGLAFALAAKDTAANLFGSVMIFSDSPFRIGDWVKFNGVEGTVEQIGFRSTKIRTFYNSLISVPNAVVANVALDNMGRREYRRVNTTIGVTYDTPVEKMEDFIGGIKEIIKNHPDTRKDYFHVVFNNYGGSSLDIMLYFFLKVPDWTKELLVKEAIFMDIKRLAAKLQVEFAFPTQSLHIESLPSSSELVKSPKMR